MTELKVEATPVGVHSCRLHHFVKSEAKCPGDMNLKPSSSLFQLYEHHTDLGLDLGPQPCTVCCHSSSPFLYFYFSFFFFSTERVHFVGTPDYILALLQLSYFPLSFPH